jgi:hypothetical protein
MPGFMTPKEIMTFLSDCDCNFEVISSEQIIRITNIPFQHGLSEVLEKLSTETDYLYEVNFVTQLTRNTPDERPFITKKQTVLFLLKLGCDFEVCNKKEQIKIKHISSEIALKKVINKLYLKRGYKCETDVQITILLENASEHIIQKKKP